MSPTEAPTPMAMATRAQAIVTAETDDPDPFAEVKRASNQEVEALKPAFRRRLDAADDRFRRAVRLAIAGNVIDVGPGHDIDVVGLLAARARGGRHERTRRPCRRAGPRGRR